MASDIPLSKELILAVERLGDMFDAKSIRYALIGGLATLMRGRPLFTEDVAPKTRWFEDLVQRLSSS